MVTSRPATRTSLSSLKFLSSPPDPAFPRFGLLGILYPANKLVSRERCDILPSFVSLCSRDKLLSQIVWQFVYYTIGKTCKSHTPIRSTVDLIMPILIKEGRDVSGADFKGVRDDETTWY